MQYKNKNKNKYFNTEIRYSASCNNLRQPADYRLQIFV